MQAGELAGWTDFENRYACTDWARPSALSRRDYRRCLALNQRKGGSHHGSSSGSKSCYTVPSLPVRLILTTSPTTWVPPMEVVP